MEDQEAQFMLLAGFIIAIGLVVITVMLNSIIFEGNKAIVAGAESSRIEIVNLIQTSRDEVRSAYRNATASGGNAVDNFNRQMGKFGYYLPAIYALHAEGINVSWENWSNKGYAYFTEDGTASGRSSWVAMEGVKNSTLVINVTGITPPFNINITNATKTWQINFTSQENRTITNDQIRANITSAYAIAFVNGANATGNFSITGNTTYGRGFIRARDYVLNATVTFSNSRAHANITIPVTVPW